MFVLFLRTRSITEWFGEGWTGKFSIRCKNGFFGLFMSFEKSCMIVKTRQFNDFFPLFNIFLETILISWLFFNISNWLSGELLEECTYVWVRITTLKLHVHSNEICLTSFVSIFLFQLETKITEELNSLKDKISKMTEVFTYYLWVLIVRCQFDNSGSIEEISITSLYK